MKEDEKEIRAYVKSKGIPDGNIVFSSVDVQKNFRQSYYYSKLNELKIDLPAKASEDAKLRAETIAKSSGIHSGKLKKATMGVFQITGKNNNEDYSFGGSFNTSSRQKTASITLRWNIFLNKLYVPISFCKSLWFFRNSSA